jgi:hypothetical protein
MDKQVSSSSSVPKKRYRPKIGGSNGKHFEETWRQIFCSLIEEPNQQSIRFFKKIGYETPKLRILYMTKRESEDV